MTIRTRTTTTRALLAYGSFVAGLAVVAFAPGCGSPDDAPSPDGGDGNGATLEFIAEASSFAGYTSWKHFHLDYNPATPFPLAPEGGAMDLVHAEGTRDLYINLGQPGAPKCVAKGATEFPVGTIIVKILAQPNPADSGVLAEPGVFSAVKRTENGSASTYNSAGAAGWEWFDLITAQNGLSAGEDPQILWSGPVANSSQAYGGDPQVCNNCHTAMGSANDSIISPALALEDFTCTP
jgi:hypothetical protein